MNYRLASLEQAIAQIGTRLTAIEEQLSQFDVLRREIGTKTARTGEMSSRIAQRLAKCETAIEILARLDDTEMLDHA